MPIYEYRCDSCGFQKEYIQRMSDAKLTDCPECKKATFNKMVTAAGFQLKGGGWYVTDFKSGGSNTNAAASKKTVEKQSDSAGKSESTTADKPKAETGAASGAATPAAPSASISAPAPSTTPASSGAS